jgi:glycosyltransferase involved in cell wall biosynthesis
MATPKIAVVIPAYKVSSHIAQVIAGIGPEVSHIFVVDDACPENSGAVAEAIRDKRIRVIRHEKNLGVGHLLTHTILGGARRRVLGNRPRVSCRCRRR